MFEYVDDIAAWCFLAPMVFFLGVRSAMVFERKRYGEAVFWAALSLHLARLAVLRIGTNGGERGFFSPENAWIIQLLGSNWTFFAFALLLFCGWVAFVVETEQEFVKTRIKKKKRGFKTRFKARVNRPRYDRSKLHEH